MTCTATFAQDIGPIDEEPWSGVYLGIHAGLGAGHVRQFFGLSTNDLSIITDTGVTTVRTGSSFSSGTLQGNVTGSSANLFIGYNFYNPCRKFLFGGQIEGDFFNTLTTKGFGIRSGSSYSVLTDPGIPDEITAINFNEIAQQAEDLRTSFNFIGRAGFLPYENILIYALGGLVEGQFVDVSNLTNNTERSLWVTGGTFGAGAEYKLTHHISCLIEYRYLGFHFKRTINDLSIQRISSPEELVNNQGVHQHNDRYSHSLSSWPDWHCLSSIGIMNKPSRDR